MSKVLVFGHKNPDTDTICSAIAMAYLKNAKGVEAEAVRLGSISDETQFVLDYFKAEAPREIGDVSKEATKVILVDHNERGQSADGIEHVEILEVVDHHRIADFQTNGPLFYRAEPVGCTATILTKMFAEQNVEIPAQIAGLLLSAIVSDTLLFKSPTCTEEDVTIGRKLAEIANVDVDTYGLAQLKAGASIVGKTAEELITTDSKPFTMGEFAVEVAQINVVDMSEIDPIKADLLAAMQTAMDAKGQQTFLALVTDILTNNSIGLVVGDGTVVEAAFNTTIVDNAIDLPGVVSRKKQVVPVMTETAAKM